MGSRASDQARPPCSAASAELGRDPAGVSGERRRRRERHDGSTYRRADSRRWAGPGWPTRMAAGQRTDGGRNVTGSELPASTLLRTSPHQRSSGPCACLRLPVFPRLTQIVAPQQRKDRNGPKSAASEPTSLLPAAPHYRYSVLQFFFPTRFGVSETRAVDQDQCPVPDALLKPPAGGAEGVIVNRSMRGFGYPDYRSSAAIRHRRIATATTRLAPVVLQSARW